MQVTRNHVIANQPQMVNREALELTVSVVVGVVAGIILSEEGIYYDQE